MALPPELIEKLRETGIRLDRKGTFWHEGEPVAHRGLHKALLRWLDRLPDGRPILRLDDTRYAYVDIEDTALLVISARREGDQIFVRLNDDSEEELLYATLVVGEGDALYCQVRGGRLDARITTAAYYVMAESIEPSGQDFVLRARGQEFAIARRLS